MRVQEICAEQRPREKALQQGLRSLSDVELLALMLGSGTRNRPVMDLAADVLKATSNLADWESFTPASFMKIPGIREVKALHLAAAVDLVRRIKRARAFRSRPFVFNEVLEWCQLEFGFSSREHFAAVFLDTKGRILRRIKRARAFRSRPFVFNEVLEWCQLEFGFSSREHFAAVFLDTKGRILSSRVLSVGTQTESLVSIKGAFRAALEENAASVMFFHNHPSQDVSPSPVLSVGTQTESLVSIKGAFRAALEENAASVMFFHNHPSQDVSPSPQDIETTRALEEAGGTMGIDVVDHIIVGGSDWFSMKLSGYMKGE